MHSYLGLDIGGTKIAGGVFSDKGEQTASHVVPTPRDYDAFIRACAETVAALDPKKAHKAVGIGLPGAIDRQKGSANCVNIPALIDRSLRDDLGARLNRDIVLANDANCLALAEAVDGAGRGMRCVLGLILGTGVGGGLIYDGKIIDGPNGLTGEIGHIPLPYREEADGPVIACGCGQRGCIDKTASGPALARLYAFMNGGPEKDPASIAQEAQAGDAKARAVLDRFYEIVAKAMIVPIHAFDPDAIVASGGLNGLPGLYEEVPKRWGKYCYNKNPKTRFVPAQHGPMAGLRGAAFLTRR